MKPEKLTRRDWFRLRAPRQNKMLGDKSDNADVAALQPIAQPPNHDGMDLSQLPPMREALLSAEQVSHLFSDIESLATEVLLMQRSRDSARATASRAQTSQQLELAGNALLSATIPRLQIRYRWQDSLWIDTLNREADGFKLVRIQHSSI